MKKVLAIMLVCFMLVSLLPMGALAEEVKTTCPGKGEDHYQSNCTNVFVKHEPGTCGGYAYDVYKCEGCGDHFADNFVKLDGACDMKVVKEADCENAGSKKCSICGKTEVIPAKGHTAGTPEGNCETGYTTKCTVCGKVITKLPGEHDWGKRPSEIVKAPNEKTGENGLAKYTCVLCGAEKEVVILTHICEENLVDVAEKPATCTKDGYTAHQKCTKCNETFGKEVLPATGHGEPEVQKGGETKNGMYTNITFTASFTGVITVTNDMNGQLAIWVYDAASDGYDQNAIPAVPAGESAEVEVVAGVKYRLYAGKYTGDYGYSYEFTEIITEGNCTTEGTRVWQCSKCHEKITENLGINHIDFVVEHEVEATCTTYGYKIVSCIACGYNNVEVYKPLGHTTFEEAKELGIVTEGYSNGHCQFNNEYSWKCVRCGQTFEKVEGPSAHDYVEYRTEATCSANALYVKYCSMETAYRPVEHLFVNTATKEVLYKDSMMVGGKYIVSVDKMTITENKKEVEYPVVWVTVGLDADKHNPGTQYAPIVSAPTCTEDGLEIYWCMDCEKDIVITTPALGHKAGEVQVKEPTCYEQGSLYQLCETCGEIVSAEPIEFTSDYVYMSYESAASAHNLEGVQPDVYKPGVCGHSYQLDRYACATCGQYILVKNNDLLNHVMPEGLLGKNDPNNTVTEIPEGVVDYKNQTITGANVTVKVNPGEDIYFTFIATEDGVLAGTKLSASGYAVCGSIYLHSGETMEVVKGQTYTINIWSNCEIYLYLEGQTARAQEFCAQDATCTEAGWTAQYYCERCDELVKSETIKALGHKIVVDVKATKATCTTAGATKGEHCEQCDYVVESVEIPALGHNHVMTDNLQPADREATDSYTYEHYECTRCDDEYINNYVAYCIHEMNVRPDRGLSKAPTCTAEGKNVYTCVNCNIVMKEEPIARLHHTNKAGADLEICANDGLTDRVCTGCKKTIAKVGHEIVDTYYDANCLTSAYIAHNCQNCAYYEITELDDVKGPHTWSDWAYVEDSGIIVGKARVCKVCGEEQIESVTCIAYSAKIENALVAGAAITDGSTVKVTISITGSEDAVWGFKFDVPYSENMTFVKAQFVTEKFTYAQVANDNGGFITVIANAAGEETLNSTEAVVELYFTVATADQFSVEELAVDFANIQTLDAAGKPVESLSAPASVNTTVLMDLDLDGEITLADALALYNLIEANGYNAAADLDKDTELTLADFLALYDYLSGVKSYEDIVALQ